MKHIFVPLDIRPNLDHHWINHDVLDEFKKLDVLPLSDLVKRDLYHVLCNDPKLKTGESKLLNHQFAISPFKINLTDIELYENLNTKFQNVIDDEVIIHITMSEHTALLLGREFWIRALPNYNIVISDVWEPWFLTINDKICMSNVFKFIKKYSSTDVPFYVSFIKPNASDKVNKWLEEHDVPARIYNFDYFILDTLYQSGVENNGHSRYTGADMNLENYINEVFDSDKPKDFVCLNRSYKYHRPRLINDLYVKGLLKNSYFSLAEIGLDQEEDYDVVKDLGLPILAEDEPTDNISNGQMSHDSVGNMLWSKNSKLFLSTESIMFNHTGIMYGDDNYAPYDIKFISEKVHKPLAWGMPFVVFGCQGSLQHMKNIGFTTFEPFIDETYDQIEDAEERYNMALQSAIDFIKQPYPINELKKICRNNFLWFYSKDLYIKLQDNLMCSILDDYVSFRLRDDWEFSNRFK